MTGRFLRRNQSWSFSPQRQLIATSARLNLLIVGRVLSSTSLIATSPTHLGFICSKNFPRSCYDFKNFPRFYDFINVAEHLAQPTASNERWTKPGNIAIVGGSAGGMLVGACLNLRPHLFKAIVAHVPFVTVLDTMLDGELPLTPGEFKEWGNPRDAGYFEYMREYCPYENLKVGDTLTSGSSGSFPSVFCTTGLTDYRVGYYEGAKWVAKMRRQIKEAKERAEKADPQGSGDHVKEPLVVMETNMAAGHAGASGRFDRLKEVSRDVAFLAVEFGLVEGPSGGLIG